MKDIVIAGIGMIPWARYPEQTITDLGCTAVSKALKDCGLDWGRIEGMAASVYTWGGISGHLAGHQLAQAMGDTGIPIQNLSNACAVGGSTLRAAASMIFSGECDITIAVGMEKSPEGFLKAISDDLTDLDTLRWMAVGVSNPGYWALELRRRMEDFGTTPETVAMTKVVTSKHGALNPNARFRRAYTLEEVLASPLVADPLRLYEICALSDGAAAVVLTHSKIAQQLGIRKPIRLAAVSLASPQYGDPTIKVPQLSDPVNDEVPIMSDAVLAAKKAYEEAGLGPEDMDLAEVPDNSAWHYLTWIEKMGFCKPGEADQMLMSGQTRIGSKLPICPSGGASSLGEAVGAQGLAQVCELTLQLRGEAGARQIEGAKAGISQVYGAHGNSAAVIVTR